MAYFLLNFTCEPQLENTKCITSQKIYRGTFVLQIVLSLDSEETIGDELDIPQNINNFTLIFSFIPHRDA